MNKFSWGLVVGLIVGGVLWLLSLPGEPSSYPPRLPTTNAPLPDSARLGTNERLVGFDLYVNPKLPPIITRDLPVPVKRAAASLASPHSGRGLVIRETIWAEYDGTLYQVGQFKKNCPVEPNQMFTVVRTLSVDRARKVSVRVQLPEIDLDETFGPFPLP